MIEEILPECAVAVEAWCDDPTLALMPGEERILGRAVEKRRHEFTTARACARAALAQLGYAPAPILAGERGEPCWPVGVVGSITHCDGYRACAVACFEQLAALGIDAEPNAPLPSGLLADIAMLEELPALRRLEQGGGRATIHWDRLLFSAKESVYKAWFPLARRPLGFEDVGIAIEPRERTFSARLIARSPADGELLRAFHGRWIVRDGLIATAIAVPRWPTGIDV